MVSKSVYSIVAVLGIAAASGAAWWYQNKAPTTVNPSSAAGGGGKPATIETGAVVRVPLFLQIGEVVKVDTRTGEYLSRVNK